MIAAGLRMGLALWVFFALAVGAICAQPYDDGGLGSQLAPEDCAPPCFLGIRPGVTTDMEAIRLLRVHPWIGGVQTTDNGMIEWMWSGTQPAFLRADENFTRISVQNGIVRSIKLTISADAADFKIVFGAPDITYFARWRARDTANRIYTYFEQYAVYADYQFETIANGRCPLTIPEMWQRPLLLTLPPASAHADFLATVHRAFAPLPEDCR